MKFAITSKVQVSGDEYSEEWLLCVKFRGPLSKVQAAEIINQKLSTRIGGIYDCTGRWFTNVWNHTICRISEKRFQIRISHCCDI
jgi:hypothetical protein